MDLTSGSDPFFDSGTYGRSFADVYDSWYPSDTSTYAAVSHISALCGTKARVLELGIGTGRLAIPLALSGMDVWGIDSSPEMLSVLESNSTESGADIHVICCDVCDPSSWPDGPFDVIISAFNFLFNVVGDDAKQSVFSTAADRLVSGGSFVIESLVVADPSTEDEPHSPPERSLEVRSITPEAVILIATSTDHFSGEVIGQHIELRDGEPVRLRPWRVQMDSPNRLDAYAKAAGLSLMGRVADWDNSPFTADSTRFIARYA
ncbi:MAG: class I SAM-dependent methyltransferase [Microthrixaceae bacterium]